MLKWTCTCTCAGCGEEFTKGPVAIGPRDEPMIGEPPEGWIRLEVHTSDHVLPKNFDQIMEVAVSSGAPAHIIDAQVSAMKEGCPLFSASFDFCEDCQTTEKLGGLIGLVEAERQRQTELEQAEEEIPNVVEFAPLGSEWKAVPGEGDASETPTCPHGFGPEDKGCPDPACPGPGTWANRERGPEWR